MFNPFNPNGESNARAYAGSELADVVPPGSGGLYARCLCAVQVERQF